MKLTIFAFALLALAIYLHTTQLKDYDTPENIFVTDYGPTWLVQNPELYTEAPTR